MPTCFENPDGNAVHLNLLCKRFVNSWILSTVCWSLEQCNDIIVHVTGTSTLHVQLTTGHTRQATHTHKSYVNAVIAFSVYSVSEVNSVNSCGGPKSGRALKIISHRLNVTSNNNNHMILLWTDNDNDGNDVTARWQCFCESAVSDLLFILFTSSGQSKLSSRPPGVGQ